ncbi:hypothetical protein KIL84_002052 [Mauremys mutica]|uniref:Ig-like domain-containing protein n=1 Tax=Mauremys mutica TaxID=74926 RepID=A0A9D3XKT2_9SAUR|nr:hypothetical protein KIL84_002052 [Mauremys mutica]
MFHHCPIDVLKACTVMGSVFHWVTAVHILTFLQMPHLISGQFKIIPPQNPVIAIIGEGVVLPCQLTTRNNAETITVQWILSRDSEKIDVSTYDGPNKAKSQDERYRGRTQFFQTEFQAGNVSLNLKDVIVSDKGKYTCSVSLGTWYDEVVVELDVTARGGESSIFMEDYADQGIGLTCRSEGWFPEPQVLWLDSKGQNRPEKPTTINTKTGAGIYNIESAINIEPGSDNEVSCKIINNILKTASESRVRISDVFFPTTSPWMAAFLVILFLSIALIAVVGYKLKKNNDTTSRSVTEKKTMEEEKERLLSTLETNKRTDQIAIQDIQENIDRLSGELEFRRAQSYAGEYKIIHPESPVIGFLGEDVTLPCQVIAMSIPGDITLHWSLVQPQENIDVSSYNRGNKEEKQDERYWGQTEFFHHKMNTGNMSLKLKNVQVSDAGNYMCRVVSGNWYDEVVIELHVTARGGESSIFLEDYAGQGIGLTCKSEGWFPEPEVLWLDSKGHNRPEKPTTINTKTPAGTYIIESSINIEPESDNEVSCKIINNILKSASESRVLISDVFFPTTSPWMAAFLVILFLSIAVIAVVGYKLKKNNDTTSHSVTEKKTMEEEKERLLSTLETNKRTDQIAIQDIQENIGKKTCLFCYLS